MGGTGQCRFYTFSIGRHFLGVIPCSRRIEALPVKIWTKAKMTEWLISNGQYAQICIIITVKPPNNKHIGTTNFVRYTKMSVARRVQRSRAYLMS